MEEAKRALRQLNDVCLRSLDLEEDGRQCYDDVGTMVTLSLMALQRTETAEEVRTVDSVSGSSNDSLSTLLEAGALEGLQELGNQEIKSSGIQQTSPYRVKSEADDFWSRCHCLAQFSSNVLKTPQQQSSTLKQTISSLHRLSLGTSCLLTAFLSVGKIVLKEHKILTFLCHLYDGFWSKQAKKLAGQIALTRSEQEGIANIVTLTKLMAAVHCLLSVHDTIMTSLTDQQNLDVVGAESRTTLLSTGQSQAINQWLCQSSLNPLLDSLTASAPILLLSAYQDTLELDKESLHKEAEMGDVPGEIMVKTISSLAVGMLDFVY